MKFTAPKPPEAVDQPQDRRLITIAAAVGGALVLLLGAVMLSADGCTDDSAELTQRDGRGERALQGSEAHLVRAFTMLEHVEEYQQGQAIALIMSQLGQWIADQPPLDDWTADPLLASLPKSVAFIAQDQRPAAMEFTIQDYFFLSEAIWTRNIASWQVAAKNRRREKLQQQIDATEDQLQALAGEQDADEQRGELQMQLAQLNEQLEPAWLAAVRKDQGDGAADELATAMQLFDWTVRNVQLDKTNWDVVLPDEADEPPASRNKPLKVAPPPPGAELHAWEALLLGHGDAANRGRVFLLLARQQNIEVIILGLKNKAAGGEPRPWAAGVVLGDQIYLFDPELGLPLPGPDDTGIATLAMLREQPELLRQLDLPDAPYPVTAEDLQQLVALIDATPQALSQRMLLVEQTLPPEHKLALTVEPSQLQRRLRKLGLDEARIWIAPYRVFQYDLLRQRDEQADIQFNMEKAVYNTPLPLFPARSYHLRGQFEAKPPEVGAKALYLACRRPDREIAAISATPEVRKEMVARSPNLEKHPELLAALLEQAQLTTIQAKRQATYWLGLVAYEDEDFGAAVDYLAERTLKADPNGRWTSGARYNLARVYEATSQHDQAIALYEADDSPQQHGNRLRARRLGR